MSRSLKEVPFEISDLVAPGSDDKAHEIYSDSVIPIYSFTGSPIKGQPVQTGGQFQYTNKKFSDNVKTDESVSNSNGYQDLESYFSAMKMVDSDGNNLDNEDGEVEQYADEEGGEDDNGNEYMDGDDDDFEDDLLEEACKDENRKRGGPSKLDSTDEYLDEDFENELAEENGGGSKHDSDDGAIPAYGVGVVSEIEDEINAWKRYQQTLVQSDLEDATGDPELDQADVSVRENDYEEVFEKIEADDVYCHNSSIVMELADEAANEAIELLSKTDPTIMKMLASSSSLEGPGSPMSAEVVKGIMDEYNDMMMVLRSPRPFSKGVFAGGRIPDNSYHIPFRCFWGVWVVVEFGEVGDDFERDGPVNESKKDKSRVPYPVKKIKAVDMKKRADPVEIYQRNQRDQKRQRNRLKPTANAAEGGSKSDAAQKHKQWLQSIQDKRKQEEEMLLLDAQKAIEKRKRFKEILLERALKARAAQEEIQPQQPVQSQQQQQDRPKPLATEEKAVKKSLAQPPAPVVRSKSTVGTGSASAAQPAQSDAVAFITASERIKAEEEQRAQIATVRRKFKEQHKKMLLALMEKNRQIQQQNEEEQKSELLNKEKRRQRALQLAAKRDQSSLLQGHATSGDADLGEDPTEGVVNFGDVENIPLSEMNTVIVNPAVSKQRAKLKQEAKFDIVDNEAPEDQVVSDLNATGCTYEFAL
jgi:hypothetical protein